MSGLESARTTQQLLKQVGIPAEWMLSPREKMTVTIPEAVNKRIDDLSSELAVTKGLLIVLGCAFLLKVVSDWMKEK
jgi:hypothetical protein